MIKIAVLDARTLGADLDLTPLSQWGTVRVFDATAPAELKARLADADVIVINKVKITRESLEGNTRLKMIAECATGFDNIDLAACREKGIAVANVK
ncbi:MAG: hydroxyacid dehydrogenase, partial [Ruminococcaceae bacterium]|nr:hydroxyacid dehydrogenase [Oscillospiraceae bacterium]